MIMLDIDDTLLDFLGAEKIASGKFGEIYASRIPDYDPLTFTDVWHSYMERYYREFLSGKMSYEDQRRNRVRAVFKDSSISDADADGIYAAYKDFYERSWVLFDDVRPFLAKYENEGFIIITDGQQEQQERKLARTGILKYFKEIVTAGKTGYAKPQSGIFQAALKLTDHDARDCYYIGDQLEKDARGARNAGMNGVWLNRGKKGKARDVIEIGSLDEFEFRS